MLQSLGIIGGTSQLTGSDNLIGRCAEVSAVNAFLYECEKCGNNPVPYYPYGCGREYIEDCSSSKDFMLSEAFRPRTLEHIDRCENCVDLFGENY